MDAAHSASFTMHLDKLAPAPKKKPKTPLALEDGGNAGAIEVVEATARDVSSDFLGQLSTIEGEARKVLLTVEAAEYSDRIVIDLKKLLTYIGEVYGPLLAAVKNDYTTNDDFLYYNEEALQKSGLVLASQ